MALSTGGVKVGVVNAASTLAAATGVTTVVTYAIASNSTIYLDADLLYQRTTNADNGAQQISAIVTRGTGSAAVASTATGTAVSWAMGSCAVVASGTSIKITTHVLAQPVRLVGKINITEVKQPVA